MSHPDARIGARKQNAATRFLALEPEGASTSKRSFRLNQPAEAGLTVQGDLRRAKRRRVLMTATLISADCAQQARIRDLTTSGAQVACETPLKRGWDVILKRGDLFVAARVAWAAGSSAGLEFYRPVDLDELAAAAAPV